MLSLLVVGLLGFLGLVEYTQLGLHQGYLLTGTLHLFLELGLEQVGLLGGGQEAEVVLPEVEVGAQFLYLLVQLLALALSWGRVPLRPNGAGSLLSP